MMLSARINHITYESFPCIPNNTKVLVPNVKGLCGDACQNNTGICTTVPGKVETIVINSNINTIPITNQVITTAIFIDGKPANVGQINCRNYNGTTYITDIFLLSQAKYIYPNIDSFNSD